MRDITIIKKDDTETIRRELENVRSAVKAEYEIVNMKVQSMAAGMVFIKQHLDRIDKLIAVLK